MQRRQFSRSLAAGLIAPSMGWPLAVRAAPYTGNVRVIVGFPPGGATDVVARSIVERLGRVMPGRTFYVENKPGAGGQIAAQMVKASPADGATIMLSIDHTQVIIPLTVLSAGYNAVTDFTPLAGVAQYYNVLAVSAATGVTTMAEFRAWLKANPAQANYGVPAAGSVPEFIGYLVGKSYGVPMNSVPYKGGAPLVQDLLGGQVPIAVASMTELIDHHKAGRVRILAASGKARSKTAPDVPTFEEVGFPGIDNPWLAFFGPKGLPADYVAQFDQGMRTVLSQPDLQERLAKLGNEVAPVPGTEVAQWVGAANARWSQVIRESGFKPQ